MFGDNCWKINFGWIKGISYYILVWFFSKIERCNLDCKILNKWIKVGF